MGADVPLGGGVALVVGAAGAPVPVYQWTRDGLTIPSATGPELDLANARPADGGVYRVNVAQLIRRGDEQGGGDPVIQTYTGWRNANFTAQEIAAGLAAGNYDYNGDGVPNLLEYALGRDPRAGNGGSGGASLPSVSLTPGGALQIQFNRDGGKTELAYTVEVSSDLQTWTAVAASTAGGATANLGGAGTITESSLGGGVMSVVVRGRAGDGLGWIAVRPPAGDGSVNLRPLRSGFGVRRDTSPLFAFQRRVASFPFGEADHRSSRLRRIVRTRRVAVGPG